MFLIHQEAQLYYTYTYISPGVQFSSEAEGMYSCIIPDENGEEQIHHFGLYDYGYTSGERETFLLLTSYKLIYNLGVF